MEQSTIEKISQVALMPGVNHIDILPKDNQVWLKVVGHKETKEVIKALADSFNAQKIYDYSDHECHIEDNSLSYSIYPEGLIISVNGSAKEKAPAVTGAEEKSTFLNSTTEMVEREA